MDPEEQWPQNEPEEDESIEEFIASMEGCSLNQAELYTGEKQLTDVSNAEMFAKVYRSRIRYCFPWGKWLIYDGKRWITDRVGQVCRYGKNVVRSMYLSAAKEEDEIERKRLTEHALKTESRRKITDMIELAKSEYGIPILPENLDQNPWLLDCNNGTLDLKTGKLLKHDLKNYITKFANVDYDINAEYPKWFDFLVTIMDGNDDLIKFLQKAIGYSMIGDTSEQVWFICYGSGANGKSTFLNTIQLILNDYSINTSTETFMLRRNEQTNDLARLKGARFVTAFESSEGRRLNESLIKQITGSDVITARHLYSEFFDFRPEFKIWLSTNHKPEITDTTYATWRRVRLIPFTVKIPENKWIKDFYKILYEEEASGIFNWMIEGCLLWQLEGLGNPDEIKTATRNYRNEMDDLNNFLADYCKITEEEDLKSIDLDKVNKYELHQFNIYHVKVSKLYSKWCEVVGNEISLKAFNRKLREKGFVECRFMDGYHWIGIDIIDESEL